MDELLKIRLTIAVALAFGYALCVASLGVLRAQMDSTDHGLRAQIARLEKRVGIGGLAGAARTEVIRLSGPPDAVRAAGVDRTRYPRSQVVLEYLLSASGGPVDVFLDSQSVVVGVAFK